MHLWMISYFEGHGSFGRFKKLTSLPQKEYATILFYFLFIVTTSIIIIHLND